MTSALSKSEWINKYKSLFGPGGNEFAEDFCEQAYNEAGADPSSFRAAFAKAAMQGLLSAETDGYEYRGGDLRTREQNLALDAVKMADALISELNKTK